MGREKYYGVILSIRLNKPAYAGLVYMVPQP